MKWIRFRIRTTVEAEDILVAAMEDIGLSGAQIEDSVPLTAAEKEQMFVDILPEPKENDGTSNVSFYAEETEDGKVRITDPESGETSERTPEEVRDAILEKIAELRSFSDESADGCPDAAASRIDIGDGTVVIEETQDIDWINNWKQYFHQFRIDDILVIPSWETPEETDDKPLLTFHIDPGTAFGTGMHETTQLCIRQMREYLTPETRILDVGTGSGILSILALKLGAKEAVGTDLDPQAIPAIADNMYENGLLPEKMDEELLAKAVREASAPADGAPQNSGLSAAPSEDVTEFDFGSFRFFLGNLIDNYALQEEVGPASYDIVVANILPDVLVPLTPAAVRALKPGGIYITSGILEGREESVVEAMLDAGLEILSITAQGEWRSVTGMLL